MLPKEFNLNNLDNGIRGLVITINRIPEVNKKTTIYGPTSCEGHIWNSKDYPSTKDGWIYFYKPILKRTGLIRRINQFCKEYPYFNSRLDRQMEEFDFQQIGLTPIPSEPFGTYEILASFWADKEKQEDVGYRSWGKKKHPELIIEAGARKKEILHGWNELDSRIKDYIINNITKDIDSLPYIDENGTTATPFTHCSCHCY